MLKFFHTFLVLSCVFCWMACDKVIGTIEPEHAATPQQSVMSAPRRSSWLQAVPIHEVDGSTSYLIAPDGGSGTVARTALVEVQGGPSCTFDAVWVTPLGDDASAAQAAIQVPLNASCRARLNFAESLGEQGWRLVAHEVSREDPLEERLTALLPPLGPGHLEAEPATEKVALNPTTSLMLVWAESEAESRPLIERYHDVQQAWSEWLGFSVNSATQVPWWTWLSDPERLPAEDTQLLALHAALSVFGSRFVLKPSEILDDAAEPGFANLLTLVRRDLSDGQLDGHERGRTMGMSAAGQILDASWFRSGLIATLRGMQEDVPAQSERWVKRLESLGNAIAEGAVPWLPALQSRPHKEAPQLWRCWTALPDGSIAPLADLQGEQRFLTCDLRGSSAKLNHAKVVLEEGEAVKIPQPQCTLHHRRLRCEPFLNELDVERVDLRLALDYSNADAWMEVHLPIQAQRPRPVIEWANHLVTTTSALGRAELELSVSHGLVQAFFRPGKSDETHGVEVAVDFEQTCDENGQACRIKLHIPMPPTPAVLPATLRLVDRFGHHETLSIVTLMENKAPDIHLTKNQYAGDFGTQMHPAGVHLAWDQPPVVLNKRADRLDHISPTDAENNNLLTLEFAVHSQVRAQSTEAPEAEVQVAYRLCRAADASAEEVLWRPLHPTDDGLYRLPLAYQTLLPRDLLEQEVKQARELNFLAKADVTDQFALEVRATDVAGNTSVKTFAFSLNLLGEDVLVSECRAHGANGWTRYARLQEYLEGHEPLLTAQMRTVTSARDHSLMPLSTLRLDVVPQAPLKLETLQVRRWYEKSQAHQTSPAQLDRYYWQIRNAQGWPNKRNVMCFDQEDCSWSREPDQRWLLDVQLEADRRGCATTLTTPQEDGGPETLKLFVSSSSGPHPFGSVLHSIPNQPHPEFELTRRQGHYFFKNQPETEVEEVTTVRALDLVVPGMTFNPRRESHQMPMPQTIHLDASCRALLEGPWRLNFTSSNR